jgi:acyl-CoA dehydrogenase
MILARLDEATAQASTLLLAGAVDGLMAARYKLTDQLSGAIADPQNEVVLAGARELALTIGHALVAALLVEHAEATGDEPSKVAAELWGRSRLAADDVAIDAHRSFDILCA